MSIGISSKQIVSSRQDTLSSIILLQLQSGSMHNDIKTDTIEDMDMIKDSISSMEEKEEYQLRALRSEGQYEDEVYNAEEGMFQEPIPIKRLDYYLVIILMYGETTTLITTVQSSPSDPNSLHNNEEDNNNHGSLHLNNIIWSRTCIGDKATTLNGTIQNGECKKIDGKEKRLKEKNHLRALRSEGQYTDEVYNAEEGMFQEPIPSLDYNLEKILIYGHVIPMKQLCLCLCLCLIILIYGHVIPMIRLCLCLCFSIVTLNRVRNVLGQSMGGVKIHTGLVNRVSHAQVWEHVWYPVIWVICTNPPILHTE
jgi:hypothetical protein